MLANSFRDGSSVGLASKEPVTRLLVTWQHPRTRRYHSVGMLERSEAGYDFAYLRGAGSIDGFRPFLGFSRFNQRYSSRHLFALFAARVMSPDRPDMPDWLNAMALDGSPPPMEVLARSGGYRSGDTIELIPIPSISPDGHTSSLFLVHGVGHEDGASERINRLAVDERLLLVEDLTNEVNPRALLVTASDHRRLGWVPDPLLGYVHEVLSEAEYDLRVVRANPPEVGDHLRLLVLLDGRISPNSTIFDRLDIEPAA